MSANPAPLVACASSFDTAPARRPRRVGYVVKRYPRYSETFIVNEILAHEAAGWSIEIFAQASPLEPHFQDALSRVRAPVTYLADDAAGASGFWSALEKAADALPGFWDRLASGKGESGKYVYQAARLAAVVKARGIDHLHAHFATSAATIARMAARFAGVPFTFTAHAKDIFHESVREEDLRLKLDDAASAITVSDFNVDCLRRRFGHSAAKVQRIYNGIDLDRLAYEDPTARPPLIVAVGRLVEKKGFDVLIDACAELAARGLACQCRIVGSGEQEASLREQIARLKLERRVELMGPRPQPAVFDLLRGAAALAAPCVVAADSNCDGLPTVLLEAMALGTPCAATDVTGIPEAVRHDETGLIVPTRNRQALADALERLLLDASLRVRLAERARRLIEAEFDVRRTSEQLRTIFTVCAAEMPTGLHETQQCASRA